MGLSKHGGNSVVRAALEKGRPIMKTLASALFALLVVASAAAPASAFDAGQFWKQYDQTHGN
jgi:hypothetical protein